MSTENAGSTGSTGSTENADSADSVVHVRADTRTTAEPASRPGLRRLAGTPLAVSLYAVLLVHLLGTFPAQRDWADRVTTTGVITSFRLLTVSPTLRFSEETGVTAGLLEALWTGLFLALLFSAAGALAARTHGPARIHTASIALLVLAPLANLLALAFLRLPALSFDPTQRGDAAYQLLADATAGVGHAVLLGCVGGLMTQACGLAAEARAMASRGDDGPSAAVQLLGPLDTLWPRIGAAVLAAAAGGLTLAGFAAELPTRAIGPVLDFWCAPGEHQDLCAQALRNQINASLPSSTGDTAPLLNRFAHLYAWQAFVLVFAYAYFMVRHLVAGLPRTAAIALSAWTAYTAGAIGYVLVLGITFAAAEGSPSQTIPYSDLPLYFLPPGGFAHALYGAPVAAAVCAGTARAYARLRRSHGVPAT